MRRMAISVEGPTEREFVNRVLRPHLVAFGWHVVRPVSMDGGISLRRIRDDLRILAEDYELVTTLYDLYGFQGKDGRDADELEAEIARVVGHVPHLIPYVQKHEFEAYLFCEPDTVVDFFQDPTSLSTLRNALEGRQSPEDINDGHATCPSRRLARAFPAYNKLAHGPLIAEQIGLARIRASCPRFATWVQKLEDAA